ncbi:MAG: hypothetical protein NTZ26_13255 [Candidatus Aminicenantes bacterium]|nr:hypothetical protein [Candidatus Aminicenantes bacterium]
MDAIERDEPDRDPVHARKTSRPCAIEDGDAPAGGWTRLKRLFRGRAERRAAEIEAIPPLEPESIPEPPEEIPPADDGPDSF